MSPKLCRFSDAGHVYLLRRQAHANHGRPDSRLWRRNLGSSPFYRHWRNHPAWQEKKNRRKNAVDHSWNDEALARAKTAPTRPGGVTRI
jgi:hypothetical protein